MMDPSKFKIKEDDRWKDPFPPHEEGSCEKIAKRPPSPYPLPPGVRLHIFRYKGKFPPFGGGRDGVGVKWDFFTPSGPQNGWLLLLFT